MKTKVISAILILHSFVSAFAGPEQILNAGLLQPDIIQQIKPELQLNADQEAKMASIISDSRTAGEPLEQAAKAEQANLRTLLREPGTSAEAASAQLAKALEAEGAVKQLTLRTLIALRDVLTPEQQKKALTLSLPKVAAKSGLEAGVTKKAAQLQAAVEALGEKPTDAMTRRGAEIEALIKSGDFQAADEALDQLIADSGLNDSQTNDAPDFSQLDPGNTDLDALKERFENVKTGAQEIVSIPLMRQFLQAKDAFEAAKSAEDAIAVGRILTWAEQKLEKK